MTEYGADTQPGLHSLTSEPWSEEFQTDFLATYHRVFDRIDAVVGEQIWNFADFATSSGIMRVDGNKKGVFTRDRRPKAAAHALRRRWRSDRVSAATARSRAEAPNERAAGLRLPQYLGYGAGDAANNLTFSMSSMFLLLYYTDVVGIAATTVGTLFLVVRVFDGFADLFAGRVVDHTNTRWGRFRPYLLVAAIPLLLLNVAVFSVPDLGATGTLVYAYVTYLLLGLAYSLVNIPYGSLATAMTQDAVERSKLATVRVLGSNVAILLLAVAVAPQIESAGDLQRSLTITTVVLAILGTGLYLFTFLTSRERVAHTTQTPALRETFVTVKQNTALLVLCGSSLVFLVGWFSLQTVTVYYARNVLGNADYYIVFTVVQTAGVFAAALLVPRLVARIGKQRVYQTLGAIAALSGIAVAFAPVVGPRDRDRGVRLLRHRPGRRQHGRRLRCRPTRSSTASGRPDRARRARRTRSSRSHVRSARRSVRRPRPTRSASAGTCRAPRASPTAR